MQNIIVPIDFSPNSYNALSIAKKITRKTRGTIHLLHVVEPVTGKYSSMGEVLKDDMSNVFMMKLIDNVSTELNNVAETNKDDLFQLNPVVKIGDSYKELCKYAREVKAELVVMGAKGMSDSEEFFIGGFTDKVIRSISCPVISVKEFNEDINVENIVFATDLEEEHKPLINLLMRMQDLFDSQLHIVKINTPRNFSNDLDNKAKLQRLADKYQLKNYTLNISSHEDEEYGILYFAQDIQSDLIAIGMHEKSGFRRIISGGSVAKEVAEHAYRPVLTYRFDPDR